MPDLQTELSKVITSWEAPEAAPTQPTQPTQPAHRPFQITTNTSRATFDYIRDNPGIARARAMQDLVAKGYKKASVSSLIVQMLRQGMLRESNGAVFITQPAYTPIKPRLVQAAKAPEPKPKRKYVRRNAAAKIAAYEAHENYNPTAPAAPTKEFDAEEMVNSLTLKQAKAVYEELKKVFG